MAGVDQVEAAIGETNLQSAPVPVRDLLDRLLQAHHLAVGGDQFVQVQRVQQFLAGDGGGALLADR